MEQNAREKALNLAKNTSPKNKALKPRGTYTMSPAVKKIAEDRDRKASERASEAVKNRL